MHSVCPHDCPSCCSLEVDVVDGRIADVTGTPGHPFTQGVICGKVREYAERVHSPLRVLTPLRRVGAKGEGRFARISWDDALAEIARRWRAIVAEHGAEAILPFSYAGSMGQVQLHAGHPLFHALAEHVKAWPPERVARLVVLDASSIVAFARRYGASPRAFIRVGIGLSRHDNGGMTCRTIACLPALTGAYADPHGGALLSSGGAFAMDMRALERPDLMPAPPPRVINMIRLGRALTDGDIAPPVKTLYVYSSNPAAVCPNQTLVLRGLAREGLFTVVHEQGMTETAHYADLVLPATTAKVDHVSASIADQGLPALPTWALLA